MSSSSAQIIPEGRLLIGEFSQRGRALTDVGLDSSAEGSDAQTAFMDTCDQTMLGGHCLQAVRAVQFAKALGRMEMSHRRLPWVMIGMAIKGMACLKIRFSKRPSNARHESLDYTLHQLRPDQFAETRVFPRPGFERRMAIQRQISLPHGTMGLSSWCPYLCLSPTQSTLRKTDFAPNPHAPAASFCLRHSHTRAQSIRRNHTCNRMTALVKEDYSYGPKQQNALIHPTFLEKLSIN